MTQLATEMLQKQNGGGDGESIGLKEGVRTLKIPCIHPVLFECWASVVDAGPLLTQHCFNVSCLLGVRHSPQAGAATQPEAT